MLWLTRVFFIILLKMWNLHLQLVAVILLSGVLQEISTGAPKPLGFFFFINYDLCNAIIQHMIWICKQHDLQSLEARVFLLHVDLKLLIFAFHQKQVKWSPRKLQQLDFISKFTTNIR